MSEPSPNGHAGGANGSNGPVRNTGDPNRRVPTNFDHAERLVANLTSIRDQFFNKLLDGGPRDINRECMYPETAALNNPWLYKELYEREPIAARVVQLMPKESWQVTPLVYEDEDPNTDTEFERAWDVLGQALRGEQCQPPGTLVRMADGEQRPIESLKDGDVVSSYSLSKYEGGVIFGKSYQAERLNQRKVHVANRHYDGEMYSVSSAGNMTLTTDGHIFSIRFSKECDSTYCVYLMRHGDWWRVGMCRTTNSWGLGVKMRAGNEMAEEAWILCAGLDKKQAIGVENIVSVKYGIPKICWCTEEGTTEKHYRKGWKPLPGATYVYENLDLEKMREGAEQALRDFDRRVEYPLVGDPLLEIGTRGLGDRFFPTQVRACNLLPEYMEVPVVKSSVTTKVIPTPAWEKARTEQVSSIRMSWQQITVVEMTHYYGEVYSIDVEEDHHYIADGIVTHNCWYQDEDGSPVWEHLQRADQLSGIGYFGIILAGIDDGRNLDQPADGVMTLNPVTNQLWPSRPRATPNPNEREPEVTVNRSGVPFSGDDVVPPSPLMVPVVNRAAGSADFVTVEQAERALTANRLVMNAPPGLPREDRGFGPNQGRHEPDGGRAATSSGADPFAEGSTGGYPTSFAGAHGTDAQYVGIQLSPPEYPGKSPSKKRRRLLFLRAFDETLVQIVQYEADIRNPRFGMPVMYRVTLNDPSTQHGGIGLPLATIRVHWSRVIHLADNLDSSEIFGVPRMRPVLNPILDVRKVRGAGAEGYWKSCFNGLALSTHPQLGGDVSIDEEKQKRVLQEYFMDLNRGLVLMGMSASTIAPSVVDPTPHINVNVEAICIQLACPIRVFKGSERGELASSQDDSSWNDRIKNRQRNYLTPRVIIPFIDRMISLGVLPIPLGKQKRAMAGQRQDSLEDHVDGALGGGGPEGKQGAMESHIDSLLGGASEAEEGEDADVSPAVGSSPEPLTGSSPQRPDPAADTGGSAAPGQGANPFLRGRTATANRGSWERKTRTRVVGYLVRNAGPLPGEPPVSLKSPGEILPDDQVIGVKQIKTESDVYRSNGGYSIEWPDVETQTHAQKAAVALQETQALGAYVQGGLEAVIPPEHFYTDVMQWPEERSRQIIEDAKAHQAETMTMPAMGADGHPTTEQEPPPPEPLMVPHGSKLSDDVQTPGGVIEGPPPPDGEHAQHPAFQIPGDGAPVPMQNAPPGSPFQAGGPPAGGPGAVAKKNAEDEAIPLQNRSVWNEFDPDQPRGDDGRFASGASSSKETSGGERLYAAIRDGDGIWRNAKGDAAPEHIQKLGIPPAWRDVHVNPDPDGDRLADGVDAKGRSQRKYGDTHTAEAAAAKFGRIAELREHRADIFREIERDAKDPTLRENAECLKVIMQTGIRPGSERDTVADHESFGATTLLGRHVQEDGSLKFATGKNKGREVEFPIQDKATAAMLKERATRAGSDGKLFNTSAADLREYSLGKDGGGHRPKDYRTCLGTETAIAAIKEIKNPTTEREYRNALKDVASKVAKVLGNTPAVALKSYIDPSVFQHWRQSSGA